MRHPLLALLACASLAAQEAPQGWTPEAMLQVKRLESPRPSPDGQWVAFTVRSALLGPEQSEFRTQIHVAATSGASRRALTVADKSSLDPKWSPDGKCLAFRSPRSGRMQVYALRMDGGEAEAITNGKGEVTAFAWSPDGKRLAYTMVDGRTEDEEKRDKAKDDARWFEEQPKLARLYLVDLAADASGNRAPRLLTPEARHVQSFDWSPDGTTLAYAHVRSPKVDHWPTADLALVNVGNGQERVLAATPAAESSPKFSRDGKTLAFTLSDPKPRWAGSHRLAVLDVASGAVRALPPTPDGQAQLLGWSGDGRHLLFQEATAVKGGLYSMKVEDGSLLRLDAGAWTVAGGAMVGAGEFVDLDPTGRYLGLVVQTASEPPTLAFSPISQFSPKVIARPNGELPRNPLPRTEVVRWKGAKGLEIEGLLTHPLNGKPGVKAPLIVLPHGGPTQMYGETYVASPSQYPLAALAARGFALLRPNIRGSSGYGRDFRFANEADWGGL
ncbi:MAG TPA: hypothetical protein VJ570_07515, partial [Holophagaceae bacterium]|nr:hypothetical protein [Holophagaceae bacterium]